MWLDRIPRKRQAAYAVLFSGARRRRFVLFWRSREILDCQRELWPMCGFFCFGAIVIVQILRGCFLIVDDHQLTLDQTIDHEDFVEV